MVVQTVLACTVDLLISDLESTDESNQTYAVYGDDDGSPNMDAEKTGATELVSGDWLIVTAEDGETTANYVIDVGSNVVSIETVESPTYVTAINNTEETIATADPTTAGQLKADIQSTDESNQVYTLHENEAGSPATAEIADGTNLSTGDWLTVTSEDEQQVANLSITVG